MTVSGPEKALSDFARSAIDRLGLVPHPEGGWYRRSWQSDLPWQAPRQDFDSPRMDILQNGESVAPSDMGEYSHGPRPLASLIYFLLPAGDASAWHVVDADELWLWHGPGPVTLELGGSGAHPVLIPESRVRLGWGHDGAPCVQLIVPAGSWQRTLPSHQDALCSCVVSPGFVYDGFAIDSGRNEPGR